MIYTFPHKPDSRINPYYLLFHCALSDDGLEPVDRMWVDDGWLARTCRPGDVLLFHWTIEYIWTSRGPNPFQQARALVGFWRFLRLARRRGNVIAWVVHDLRPFERWTVFEWIGFRLLAGASDLCGLHSESARTAFVARYPFAAAKSLVFDLGNYDGYYPAPRPATVTRAAFGVPPHARLLLACGMVRPYKGLETAIDAIKRLPAGYHLLIAGHPKDRVYAADLQTRIGGRPDVTFLDRSLTEQEFADAHAAADCVLLPYHMITGSSAVLAACTFGRGVVASDLPYFRELLADEPDAGVLVRPDESAALATGIERFFAADVPARHAAARRIADRYPWSECIRPFADRLRAVTPAANRTQGLTR